MPRSPITVALAGLAATFLFFFEYVPPLRQVHIPYDLGAYHYPLADYAFQSLKQGRFPQWDPSIYSGMDFVSNIQAALFYPPTWLMFTLSWGRDRLSYQALEDLTLAHVWLAFLLCYLWLGAKRLDRPRPLTPHAPAVPRQLDELPCILGAAVYAFGGYLCTQLQHFGLVAGYAWFPLALWGVDDAARRLRADAREKPLGAGKWWRPRWKVIAASALCFLAGYPPTWLVLAICGFTYAAGQWGDLRFRARLAAGAACALAISLALCAIQLLPAMEASAFRTPEVRFGDAGPRLSYYISYLVPNYYNFGLNIGVDTNPGRDYLYLGAPGILGMLLLAVSFAKKRPSWSELAPILPAITAGSVAFLIYANPFDLIGQLIRATPVLSDVMRSYYFLAGISIALAELSAHGLDRFLSGARGSSKPLSRLYTRAAIVALGTWALILIFRWPNDYPAGLSAFADPMIGVSIFAFGFYVYRAHSGFAQRDLRVWLALALITFAGIEYKVFGTSKRLNAAVGLGPRYSSDQMIGMDRQSFDLLGQNTLYRVAVDGSTLFPQELRHHGWITPQGFDPFLSTRYRELLEQYATFETDRFVNLDPDNAGALALFGVRYFVSADPGPLRGVLESHPRFRLVGSQDSYYKVFEYLDAEPPYGFLSSDRSDQVDMVAWQPERRALRVHSSGGGRLTLSEQHYPGWTVSLQPESGTGRAVRGVPPDQWQIAFQSIQVPAGDYLVEFRYRSRWLLPGAAVSIVTLAGLLLVLYSRFARPRLVRR